MKTFRLSLLLVLITACVSPQAAEVSTTATSRPTTTTTRVTSSILSQATQLEAHCGAVKLPIADPLVLPDEDIDDDARSALEATANMFEPMFHEQYAWFIAERTEERLVLFGRPSVEMPPGHPPFADAQFTKENGAWKPEGVGQCRVEVSAPGYGNATWTTDPTIEPDPSSSELAIQIMERNCASGEPPIGREVLPVVVGEADRVTVTVLVEPVSGNANCMGNPWYPMVVDLGEPLGDRALYDGSTLPAQEQVWPPPEDSLGG